MTRMAAPVPFARPQYPELSLHGRIVHAIGRRIVSGDLAPGDLLPAEPELGASRTVIREAIKVLAAKGLVESRPKTGTRVRPRQAWSLLDPDVLAWQQQEGAASGDLLRKLTEVRRIIEPAAAELAAARAAGADVAALASALDEMALAALPQTCGDVQAFVQADMRFHLAILKACRNELLEEMSRVVYSALLVSFRATSGVPGRARAAVPKHRAILDAIRARDPRGAAVAMRHLVQTTAREIEALGQRAGRSARGPREDASLRAPQRERAGVGPREHRKKPGAPGRAGGSAGVGPREPGKKPGKGRAGRVVLRHAGRTLR